MNEQNEIINQEAWYKDENKITQSGQKEFVDCIGLQVWTRSLEKHPEECFRHKMETNIYRIRTKHGIADDTEDHSLDKHRNF